MAKAKTKVAAKKKSVVKKTPVIKKVEEPVVEEKVEEPVVEEKVEEPVVEPVVEEKPAVQETKTEEVTHTISHRNVDVLVGMVNEFIDNNVKSGNLISSTKVYDPNSEKRIATIVYKK